MDFMTKHNKLIAAFLLIAFVFGMVPAAFAADSSITYVNGAEKFVFVPSDDLFDNFKGVMPGDTIEQKITVKNGSSKTVKIFLRAVANENTVMQGFLQQLSMTVKQGDKTLFDASPAELDGLEENVLLGQFAPNQHTDLVVTLKVPITLGNAYANLTGVVDWVFTVEEVIYSGGGSESDADIVIPGDDTTGFTIAGIFNRVDHYAYVWGYPDGTVQPNANITRAEITALFTRLLLQDVWLKYKCETNNFEDVLNNAWFHGDVSTMANMNVIGGYPDGTFKPNDPITRAEFAAIISKFDQYEIKNRNRFPDIAGHWAEEAILEVAEAGWVGGYEDGTFRPEKNLTRAETMVIINKMLGRTPQSVDDLLDGMITWPDNADPTAWYYIDVQEATNGHDYTKHANGCETWTLLKNEEEKESFLERILNFFRK